MLYFCQLDKRWADDVLGFGKTRLGTHGCFVTSLGNLCGKTPREVNHILQKGKFFNGDLIISSEAMAKSLGLTYAGRSDKQPKYRCIAEVDMSPSPGKQQHFVLIKEDGSIIDSWTGTIRPKGTYPIVSYRLFRAVEASKEKSDTKVPLSPENAPNEGITPVESIPQEVDVVNNQPQEQIMNLTGYRTIISAVLAFVVTLGAISQGEADQLTEGVLALLSVVTLASTIYFRLKAKK